MARVLNRKNELPIVYPFPENNHGFFISKKDTSSKATKRFVADADSFYNPSMSWPPFYFYRRLPGLAQLTVNFQ
jgi:hypothetical protein